MYNTAIHDIKYQVSPYSITINYWLDRNIGICGSINGYDCKSFVRLFNVAGLYDVTANPHITWRVYNHMTTLWPWYFATRARGAWYHVTCARDVTHSEIFWYFGRCYSRFYCLCCIYWGTPVWLCRSYYCHWVVVLSKGVLFGIYYCHVFDCICWNGVFYELMALKKFPHARCHLYVVIFSHDTSSLYFSEVF